MRKKVVIIGGGLGGLSAAIQLARKGFIVQLFEQNEHLGGKMNLVKKNGYSFDTGPSLLTMPVVIDNLFETAGLTRDDHLQFVPIEPICRYFWDDETTLDSSNDVMKMQSEIEKFSKHDAQNYTAFLKYAKRIYELTSEIFLFNPIHELAALLRLRNLLTLFRIFQIDPFRTMHKGIIRYFHHPKIIQLFDRYATYNGSDPFQAPATLNIISYVEYGLGCYYVKGGMYRLVKSLERVAIQTGVDIVKSAKVEKILYNRNKIQGVVVHDRDIKCDIIVCNADVVNAYNELIDNFTSTKNKLNKLEPSLSGVVFLWGVKQTHEQLTQHNIFFSNNYSNEFKQIFSDHVIPDDPTIYIAITSKNDPSHAPSGCENWFVLVNTPYVSEQQDWEQGKNQIREKILRKLKNSGIDVFSKIEFEKTFTPQDFYDLYGSNRGSIYGISSNQTTTAFRRPANRNRDIRGLYFAGGSTHPGGGVPLAILSGKICADLITTHYR